MSNFTYVVRTSEHDGDFYASAVCERCRQSWGVSSPSDSRREAVASLHASMKIRRPRHHAC